MKVVELTKAAAGAEVLRFRRQLLRYGRQVGFIVAAGLFGIFALLGAHVVLWTICYGPWNFGRVWASVTVVGVDAIVALMLLMFGRGKLPDPIEIEARITRDRTVSELRSIVAMTAVTAAVTGPAGRLAGRSIWAVIRRLLPGRKRTFVGTQS